MIRATHAPSLPRRPYLTLRPQSGWAALNLRELWLFRELIVTLAVRDLKLRYKQTALGVAWVIFQPLMAAGIFSFVFGIVADLPSGGQPYFLFAYAGLLGWKAFQTTVTQSSLCLLENVDLVAKVFFPRLALPLSMVPSALVDFTVALGLMAVLLPAYQIDPHWRMLLLPIWLTILLTMAAGIGLILSALTVQYRDVKHILPVFVQMLLYASPVAYAVSAVPERYRDLYYLNPLAAPLEAFRWSLLGTSSPEPDKLAYSAVAAALLFGFGAVFFKRAERKFADVI